ncbi:hypothetical protein [Porcipelethomonas sp.]|jgi:hypothetical protein|uniref:hypothetical protein n=1 Tax=Porcipelethomonas sp. TaxID=2981675 RepID=UPI00307B02FB
MDYTEAQVDHYKETCEIQRENIKNRNRFFVLLWIDLLVLYLLMVSENEAVSAIQGWIKEQLGIESMFSPSIFLGLGWILLLYFCIRYIQTNVKIERDYFYINRLEEEIKSNGCNIFSREGKSYLDNYPFVLNYIDFLYKWFFPALLVIFVLIKIILEVVAHQSIISLIIDICLALTIIILWIGYVKFIFDINKMYDDKANKEVKSIEKNSQSSNKN